MPLELAHVWEWFTDVFNPGGIGMGPYRTEYREIEAYARVTGEIITPSEAKIIRLLCETYMRVESEKEMTKNKGAPPGTKNLTDMTDSSGLKSIFSRMGAKPAKKK